MFKIIKKADIVLFCILLIAGTGLSVLSFTSASAGEKVEITVDGSLYGTYSLSENQVIEVAQEDALNKITIKDGYVQMSYSTCKNQVCTNHGKINKTNESIVCLPNRVMIKITGGEEDFEADSN